MSRASVQFVEMARTANANRLTEDPTATLTVEPDGRVRVTLHTVSREMFDRLPGDARDLSADGLGPLWVKDILVTPTVVIKAFTHEAPTKESAPCSS